MEKCLENAYNIEVRTCDTYKFEERFRGEAVDLTLANLTLKPRIVEKKHGVVYSVVSKLFNI